MKVSVVKMEVGDSSTSIAVDTPQIGMEFSSEEELRDYYKSYAQSAGFGYSKLASKKGDDGQQKYMTFGCCKHGKKVTRGNNSLYSRPSFRTDCKAKINVTVQKNGMYVISTIHLEHNHTLSPSKSSRYKEVLDSQPKRRLESSDQARITSSKNLRSSDVEACGYENLSFDERNCQNYVVEARKLRLENGNGEAMNKYFCSKQCRNANFFYMFDVDEDLCVRNVFWTDARCRASYEYFSDVVIFDTTYLTKGYDIPFVSFVGVNHHGQSVLLGCGLISKEDLKTFVWLFRSWLTSMGGRAPRGIITDQCEAMEIAILQVFPNSHHRLCLWHIIKKVEAKFSSHANYKSIKKSLKVVVYNSLTPEECESNWKKMIEEFNLENDDWLNSLYEARHKWLLAFVKDKFWAGMSTSHKSKSMNVFFDEYIHSKTTLKQFFEQFDNAMKTKITKEHISDSASFKSCYPVITDHPIEKQFQSIYTNNIFKLLQDEIRGLIFCNTSFVKQEGSVFLYEVLESVLGKDGSSSKEISFLVQYSESPCQMKCLCRLFEFQGILCRHLIAVLFKRNVLVVPENYILERWRKDVNRLYQGITYIYDDACLMTGEERKRYNYLQPLCDEVLHLASKSEKNFSLLVEVLKEMKQKFMDVSKQKLMDVHNGDSFDGNQDSNMPNIEDD